MHTTFRIVALTAALAALSSAASAADVRLNFDDLGKLAEIPPGKPIEVGTLRGLQFTGAYAYGVGMLTSDDPENLQTASTGKGGFVLNKARGGSTTDIIISVVQSAGNARSAAPSMFFESITFNLFTKGTGTDTNKLFATGVNGEDAGKALTSGGGDRWTTSAQTVDFDPIREQVTSLRFSAGGAAFALDNMWVSVSGTSSVPEPASYGLVGLALVAVGAASRRRQRG